MTSATSIVNVYTVSWTGAGAVQTVAAASVTLNAPPRSQDQVKVKGPVPVGMAVRPTVASAAATPPASTTACGSEISTVGSAGTVTVTVSLARTMSELTSLAASVIVKTVSVAGAIAGAFQVAPLADVPEKLPSSGLTDHSCVRPGTLVSASSTTSVSAATVRPAVVISTAAGSTVKVTVSLATVSMPSTTASVTA